MHYIVSAFHSWLSSVNHQAKETGSAIPTRITDKDVILSLHHLPGYTFMKFHTLILFNSQKMIF